MEYGFFLTSFLTCFDLSYEIYISISEILVTRFIVLHFFVPNMFWDIRASDYPSEKDGACLQMRLSYSPAAQFFLFFVQWADCHLAGALGLLRILIYKVISLPLYKNCLTTSIIEYDSAEHRSMLPFYCHPS